MAVMNDMARPNVLAGDWPGSMDTGRAMPGPSGFALAQGSMPMPHAAPPTTMEFGSPEEAVAVLEQAIQLLKSGQIEMQELITVMRAAMQAMMRRGGQGPAMGAGPRW